MKQNNHVFSIIRHTALSSKKLPAGVILTVTGAVISALLPPLILEKIVNRLSLGLPLPFALALLYFGFIALTGLLESARECLLTLFGQKITRSLRHELCAKLSRLDADTFVQQDPGAVVSRFVGDADTVETLFTSGIISMAADFCKVISIFAIIFVKNKGLALVLMLLLPLLYAFTRFVQKRMKQAQLENRAAVAKVTNHVPETIRTIRTIHTLGTESYMRKKYDSYIEESYQAMEKTNFFDSIYSPVVLILNALIIAVVLLLASTGNEKILSFFGMSIGTSVAVISYISQIFAPLESIGMEIQTIQSAIAGVYRINEFLSLDERMEAPEHVTFQKDAPCIELKNVHFGYETAHEILHGLSFTVHTGEHLTLAGKTGAGKSTIFKLLLGLYRPSSGQVLIHGVDAFSIPDKERRFVFGYVEQTFRIVPGSIADQISLFDDAITRNAIEKAAMTVGLHDTILQLENGYDTPCVPSLFSQGQWQLLSIARAIVSEPEILLLDEITANLDADTESTVLSALKGAAKNRTMILISHRLYEQNGGRTLDLTAPK